MNRMRVEGTALVRHADGVRLGENTRTTALNRDAVTPAGRR